MPNWSCTRTEPALANRGTNYTLRRSDGTEVTVFVSDLVSAQAKHDAVWAEIIKQADRATGNLDNA